MSKSIEIKIYHNTKDVAVYQTNYESPDIIILHDSTTIILPIHKAKKFCKELMIVLIASGVEDIRD